MKSKIRPVGNRVSVRSTATRVKTMVIEDTTSTSPKKEDYKIQSLIVLEIPKECKNLSKIEVGVMSLTI